MKPLLMGVIFQTVIIEPHTVVSKLRNKAAYVNIAPIVPIMKPLLMGVIFQTVREMSFSELQWNLRKISENEVASKVLAFAMKFCAASPTDIADTIVTRKGRKEHRNKRIL
ncbi:hypothetical protein AVEN_25316-1 [Araneus ventricosus]|uniref:Uncharacterized protein n=1 Tax=Araneus ventricosus TaxID=182803 RepID=A0A4Y2ISN3_ARAVE|nr:hypothetical protein AVEN_25316-1 [Araneus ventricosus]